MINCLQQNGLLITNSVFPHTVKGLEKQDFSLAWWTVKLSTLGSRWKNSTFNAQWTCWEDLYFAGCVSAELGSTHGGKLVLSVSSYNWGVRDFTVVLCWLVENLKVLIFEICVVVHLQNLSRFCNNFSVLMKMSQSYRLTFQGMVFGDLKHLFSCARKAACQRVLGDRFVSISLSSSE